MALSEIEILEKGNRALEERKHSTRRQLTPSGAAFLVVALGRTGRRPSSCVANLTPAPHVTVSINDRTNRANYNSC